MTGTRIRLTHPKRELFPDGISKQDVAAYYELVSGYMLPYLRDRPLVMQRFPEGIEKDGFYQKNASDYFPDWIQQIEVPKQDGTVHHVLCNDLDTLIYLVNQGCVTFHTWLSRTGNLDHPDVMVFDLDPQREQDEQAVREGALELRQLLDELELVSFVQTSGSRGYHVDVPLDGSEDFDAFRAFARDIAEELVQRNPKRFTTEHRKSKRGNRIFLDTLRNAYAQTAVAPYSLRAKPGAPAATPLTWEEIEAGDVIPTSYNLGNMGARLAESGDPWSALFQRRQSLSAAAARLASDNR